MNVMLDIETLGLEPGCSIISIGAVKFDADEVGEEFYRSVDVVSCEAAGLHIDADTLRWWLKQDGGAQQQLTGGLDLAAALGDLAEFIDGDAAVWANSPSFDCSILEAAYEAVGIDVPWSFYQERDFRTLKELPVAADVGQDGVEHDALDDARYQARVASQTLARLSRLTEGDDA